jgi:small-conductance mechanosensitive channel
VQTIPFSQAKNVTNYAREFAIAEFIVSVAPQANLEDVQKAFASACAFIRRDEKYADYLLGELTDIGVKSIAAQGIVVSSTLRTKPDPEKAFAAEFNKRLAMELQKSKIPLGNV